MGYGKSGLLLTQVHDLRLEGGILNGRADNTISGSNDSMVVFTLAVKKTSSNGRICQARGRNLQMVDPVAWQSTCARRGYLLYRANPRGY